MKTFFHSLCSQGSVIVVGAGIAGIGAARQLQNAGCKVRMK